MKRATFRPGSVPRFARPTRALWIVAVGAWLGAASGCTDSAGPPPAVATNPPPAIATGPVAVPAIDAPPAVAQNVPPTTPPEAAGPGAPNPGQNPPQPRAKEQTPSEPGKPRPILGKKTGEVRDAQKELGKGAQRASSKIKGNDFITLSGNAYISIVGSIEVKNMKHTLDLYHALNDRYPKDLNEFMNEIVKKSGVRLTQLPYYQEYAYDADKHELIILEYPDLKEGR